MRPHALRADLFGCLDRETERIPVERKRLVDVLNGDADVIEDGGSPTLRVRSCSRRRRRPLRMRFMMSAAAE